MPWKDIAERALWTFAQAFAAALFARGTLDIDTIQAAALAGAAAVLSLVKGLVASRIGSPDAALPSG